MVQTFPLLNLGLQRHTEGGLSPLYKGLLGQAFYPPSLFSQENEKCPPPALPISPVSQSLLLLVTSYLISK